MIAGILLGVAGIAYGIAADNAGEFWLGVFILCLLAVEPITDFVRRERRLYRNVVRRDFEDRR